VTAFCAAAFCAAAFCACSGEAVKDDEAADEVEMADEEKVRYKFQLLPVEKEAYDEYAEKLDASILEGMSMTSVAKIFIQSCVDKNVPAEYNLYHPDTVPYTLEEYIELNETDGRPEGLNRRLMFLDTSFAAIDGADVKHVSQDTASINFKSQSGENIAIIFKANENGPWLLEFGQFERNPESNGT
jgi:hypothetical protein